MKLYDQTVTQRRTLALAEEYLALDDEVGFLLFVFLILIFDSVFFFFF